MLAYRYNEKGEYIGEIECQLNPVASKREGKDIFLLPAFATLSIPNLQEGFISVWNGNDWQNVEIPKIEEKPIEEILPIEENSLPSLEERISALEEAMLEMMLGGAE